MNLFQQLSVALRAYGLSDDPAHKVQDVYRSANGRLWHLKPGCGRLARSGSVTAEKADLAAPTAWNVCSTCMPQLSDRLVRFERVARSYDEVRRQLERLYEAEISWTVLSKAEGLINDLAALQRNDVADVWHTEISQLSLSAQQFANSIRAQAFNKDALMRASAVAFVRGEEVVSQLKLTEFGDPTAYRQPSRKVTVEQAWQVWQANISTGVSFDGAAAEAAAAVVRSLGDVPVSMTQLPEETVLCRDDFPSLHAWLNAEWALKRDRHIATMCELWKNRVEVVVQESAEKPDCIVLCALDSVSGRTYAEDPQRQLLSPFGPQRLATNPNLVVVRVPRITADWIELRNRNSYNRNGGSQRVEAEESDTPELLAFVAGLLDFDGGEMGKLETVLAVARATHA